MTSQPASGGLRGGLQVCWHPGFRSDLDPSVPRIQMNAKEPRLVGSLRGEGQPHSFREARVKGWGRDVICGSTRLSFDLFVHFGTGCRREQGRQLSHGAKRKRHRRGNHHEFYKQVNWPHCEDLYTSVRPSLVGGIALCTRNIRKDRCASQLDLGPIVPVNRLFLLALLMQR